MPGESAWPGKNTKNVTLSLSPVDYTTFNIVLQIGKDGANAIAVGRTEISAAQVGCAVLKKRHSPCIYPYVNTLVLITIFIPVMPNTNNKGECLVPSA